MFGKPFHATRKDVSSDEEATPGSRDLIVAAAKGNLVVTKYYLDHGVPVDAAPAGKPSALCYAALGANEQLLSMLISRGAQVNFRDGLGNTPCIYAVLAGAVNCLEELMRWGANPDLKNHCDRSAVDYAGCCEQHQHRIRCLLGSFAASPADAPLLH